VGRRQIKLKRKKDNIIITNNKGDTIVKNKKAGDIIFNNSTVSITVNNTFSALQSVPQIEGLTIKDSSSENLFQTDKQGFGRLAIPNPDTEEISDEKKIVNRYKVALNVFKIVFGPKHKWEFFFDGVKISAQIDNENFFQRLLKGEFSFMNGDILIVDLKILQVFNPCCKNI
jgi:hypothetical protein